MTVDSLSSLVHLSRSLATRKRNLEDNALTTLPAGIFEDLTALEWM